MTIVPSRRAILATCGSALLAGCSALERDPSGSGSWPQYGADRARTGSRDVDGPEPPLTTAWSYEYGTRTESGSPIVADGAAYTVYAADPYADEVAVELAAIDAETGESRWTTTVTTVAEPLQETMPFADSLALADDAVLVQTANGLFAVDADGTERWQFDNVGTGQLSTVHPVHPGVDDDTVYTGHYRHTDESESAFYAVDLANGTERWRYDLDEWDERLVYSPAVSDGVVYVVVGDGGVEALDAADGTGLWSEPLPVYGAPAVSSDAVFVSLDTADAGGAAALAAETGEVRWIRESDDPDSRLPAHIAVSDGAVFYDVGTHVVARDAATGDRVWSADDPFGTEEAWTGIAAPAVADDRLYVSGSELFVLDRPDGTLLGSEPVESLRGSPAVTDDLVYVASAGELRALTACESELFGHCLR